MIQSINNNSKNPAARARFIAAAALVLMLGSVALAPGAAPSAGATPVK